MLRIDNNSCEYCENKKKEKNNYFFCKKCESSHFQKIDNFFHCLLCEMKTKYIKTIRRHVDTIHNPYSIKYKCNFCDFITLYKSVIKSHVHNKHFKPEENKILSIYVKNTNFSLNNSCKFCHDNMKTRKLHSNIFCKNCESHLYKNVNNYFECLLCSHKIKTNHKKRIEIHINTIHNPNPIKFKCKFCNFLSFYKSSVKVHIFNQHFNTKEIKIKTINFDLNTNKFNQNKKTCNSHKQKPSCLKNKTKTISNYLSKVKKNKYFCPLCLFCSYTIDNIIYHFKNMHE